MTRVIACCGVGGSGKTTAAAALGLALALRGQRVVVLTIDPARRLADALGVQLGNDPRPVPLHELGIEAPGTLDALMLDRKATFDGLVRRFAADADHAERLLSNRYYAAVSTRLTGSHEYMAIEKLQELVERDRWDVVVLDTPPAQHAIDFFRAPERISRLFDRGVLSVLTQPARGLMGAATRSAMKLIERIAGATVLQEITEFFQLVSGLQNAIRDRNLAVSALLRSERTRFYLVTPARRDQQQEVAAFTAMLSEQGLRLHGLLFNRVLLPPKLSRPLTPERLPGPPPATDPVIWADMVDALTALPARADSEARQHAAAMSRLTAAAGHPAVAVLPDLPGGVRTVEELAALVPYLPVSP